ncbi:MAG: asparagine synthase C-terminal domain-containing protein [Halobellus sp.]|uniref:asparagine synthase C-terminal domain-containing protein n=1 Tax=Halobellus sp. TaxID=1979212 RepID=UPI0035D4023E
MSGSSDSGPGVTAHLDGASSTLVRDALDTGEPLPGTAGFAGEIDDSLVRDVLGRRPLFVDASDPAQWSFVPTSLENPVSVRAGTATRVGTASGSADPQWTLPDPTPATDRDAALAAVRDAVRERTRAVGADGDHGVVGTRTDDEDAGKKRHGDVAVAFSGGVDSGVVAAGVPDAPCYVAGFEGCHDIAAARDAATTMDRDLRVVELSHADLREAVPRLADALGRTNPMDLSIAVPLLLVAERVAADGYDRLALGQGADELFGGYAKVQKAPDDPRVEADSVRGARRELLGTIPEQAERDVLAIRLGGVEPVTPLLHDDVVAAALPLPESLLVDSEARKVALREAARGFVPDTVRTADKKAVQYGTYVSRELDRLARQAGFKRRMDNHVERYVKSLVADV